MSFKWTLNWLLSLFLWAMLACCSVCIMLDVVLSLIPCFWVIEQKKATGSFLEVEPKGSAGIVRIFCLSDIFLSVDSIPSWPPSILIVGPLSPILISAGSEYAKNS